MDIRFTKHAEEKFGILEKHQFFVSRKRVLSIVESPDAIDRSRYPLTIAQGAIDADHVLRIVYRREAGVIVIITFYPGRKTHYEKKTA